MGTVFEWRVIRDRQGREHRVQAPAGYVVQSEKEWPLPVPADEIKCPACGTPFAKGVLARGSRLRCLCKRRDCIHHVFEVSVYAV